MKSLSSFIMLSIITQYAAIKAGDTTLRRFNTEYPAGANRILKRFENLKGSYSIKLDRSGESTVDFAFLNGREFFKRAEALKSQRGKAQMIENIHLLFRDEYYELTKRPDQNRFLLSERGTAAKEGLRYENRYGVAQMSPLGIRPAFLIHMKKAPGFELVDANIHDPKTGHVQVDVKFGIKEPKTSMRYLLDPLNDWAVISEETFAGANSVTQSLMRVDYGAKHDGFAFPKTVRLTIRSQPEEVYRFGPWSTGTTADNLFSLANYGLAEPETSTNGKPDTTGLQSVPPPSDSSIIPYLIVIPAIVLLILGIRRIVNAIR